MRMNIWIVLGTVLIAIGAAFAPLAIVSRDLTDDAYIDYNHPDTNYGSEPYIEFGYTMVEKVGYIHFDIYYFDDDGEVIRDRDNITINNAKLTLTTTPESELINDDGTAEVCVAKVNNDNPWYEDTITANSHIQYTFMGGGDACIDWQGGDTLTFTVTSIVQHWLNYPNAGFAFVASGWNVQAYSKEATSATAIPPTLEINWTDPDGADHGTIIDDDGIDDTVDDPIDDDDDTDDTDTSTSSKTGITTDEPPDWAWWILALGIFFLIIGIYKSKSGR